jgi:hypothetical protein
MPATLSSARGPLIISETSSPTATANARGRATLSRREVDERTEADGAERWRGEWRWIEEGRQMRERRGIGEEREMEMEERRSIGRGMAPPGSPPSTREMRAPRHKVSSKFVYRGLANENKEMKVSDDDRQWSWAISQKYSAFVRTGFEEVIV